MLETKFRDDPLGYPVQNYNIWDLANLRRKSSIWTGIPTINLIYFPRLNSENRERDCNLYDYYHLDQISRNNANPRRQLHV